MFAANLWKAAVMVKSFLFASSILAISNCYSNGIMGVRIFLTTKHRD